MRIEFYANGRKRRITVRGLFETPQPSGWSSAVVRALSAGPLTVGSHFSARDLPDRRLTAAGYQQDPRADRGSIARLMVVPA